MKLQPISTIKNSTVIQETEHLFSDNTLQEIFFPATVFSATLCNPQRFQKNQKLPFSIKLKIFFIFFKQGIYTWENITGLLPFKEEAKMAAFICFYLAFHSDYKGLLKWTALNPENRFYILCAECLLNRVPFFSIFFYPEFLHFKDLYGNTLLHLACEAGSSEIMNVMQPYLTFDLIYTPNQQGLTPLHLAIRKGDFQLIMFLIRLGGVKLKDGTWTPLHEACKQGNHSIALLFAMQEKNALYLADTKSRSCWELLCYYNHLKILSFFLGENPSKELNKDLKWTALLFLQACKGNALDIVAFFFEHADMKKLLFQENGNYGINALNFAIFGEHDKLLDLLITKAGEEILSLKDPNQETALHLATMASNPRIAEKILSYSSGKCLLHVQNQENVS